MINVSPEIQIPDQELIFSYSRSSGKGGQNVNKTSTKALLKWNVMDSLALSQEVKDRFLKRYQTKLNSLGEVVISSDRFRAQPMNTQDCIDKLVEMILIVEKPPKARKKTKPSKSQKKKRLETKKIQSDKKKNRRVSW